MRTAEQFVAHLRNPRQLTIHVHPKLLVVGAVGLALLAVSVTAIIREWSAPKAAPAPPRAIVPTRAPLSAEEEQYIAAVWPIHGDVERSTAVMSLGEIFYLNQDPSMPLERFKQRVDAALATYDQAAQQLQRVAAPQSLERKHAEYVAAIGLLQASTRERRQFFVDANIDHLHKAYPPLQQATNDIRRLGSNYWPDEFVPH